MQTKTDVGLAPKILFTFALIPHLAKYAYSSSQVLKCPNYPK